MSKKYISDQNLEEHIINSLRRKAKANKIKLEDFSFKTILSDLQNEFDVSEKN